MYKTRFILSILFVTFVIHASSQIKISEINVNKVKYKKVRDYLQVQQSHNINSLFDIQPSMYANTDEKGFRIDERIYRIKGKLSKVWKHYLNTNPGDSWNGNKVSFGLLLSKKENRAVYQGERISRIDTGQIVYLNLKLFKGLTNLATVFEFISIDPDKKILEFSYIDGNVTEGKQQLRFSETAKGYTEIIHTTFFKSNSVLRDKFYPYFHARMINEFHRNMKKLYHSKQVNYVAEYHEPVQQTNSDIEAIPGSLQ